MTTYILLGAFALVLLLVYARVVDRTPAIPPPKPPAKKDKNAPLSREQAVNVQREIQRQRAKKERHDMMRRGTYRQNMRNSKRGRKG